MDIWAKLANISSKFLVYLMLVVEILTVLGFEIFNDNFGKIAHFS